ncbi:NUDIX domain-containing protein [Trueperella pecoris]|uniref:NUDIX domain-containing protein n=1 Tax=Trueperella pecoris TaxID=2733571 RepID=UPI00186B63E7|nr:NUDIX hydrolase [Trueperella pecoris]QOQ38754.1 NUDIX hydrolase [Trueperella pecoris]
MHKELRDISAPDHVRLTDRIERFRGPIFTIYDDEIEFSSGERARRQWMDHDDAVAVVALRPSSRPGEDWDVLLIRQYRHSPRRMMWEIPAGLCDEQDEAEVATAARELHEETGYIAASWYRLVNFVTSPGVSNEDLAVYLAFELTHRPSSFVREAEEAEIELAWFGLREVTDAVMRADLGSPSLVAGVLAANVALGRGLDTFDEIRIPDRG